jgi:alginate O-acetyltransferase complex protein AlgJ
MKSFCFVLLIFSLLSLQGKEKLIDACKLKMAEVKDHRAIVGLDQWLFKYTEIRHLSELKDNSEKIDLAIQEIVNYQQNLAKNNVALLLLPIPPKALIHSEKFQGGLTSEEAEKTYESIFKKLNEHKVQTVNLIPAMKKLKSNGLKLYCQQDSHFSPTACIEIAKIIKKEIKTQNWAAKLTKTNYKKQIQEISFEGDLVRTLDSKQKMKMEKLNIRFIENENHPPKENIDSPILLIGDSHCLIFHEGGDMLARGGGLFEQISYEMMHPIDLIAVKGGGINIARLDLFRRCRSQQYLAKKKIIIWCFAASDFTEKEKWEKIPLQ